MKHKKNLLIIGGDKRQLYMPEFLIEKGFDVTLFGFSKQENKYIFEGSLELALIMADAIILPLPVSRDGVNVNAPFFDFEIPFDEILSRLQKEKPIFGGMFPREWTEKLSERDIRHFDYFTREELTLLNAIPTAEGVVGTIICNLPITVKDARVAITGFGRCGAATAKALKALDARVTVFVRSSLALAKAKAEGYDASNLSELPLLSPNFDVVVNTVPALIIDREVLSKMREDAPVIEIASAPFGVDFEAAQDLKIRVLKEGSIPGRIAPKTAGEIISNTICQILEEEKEWKK